MLPFTTLAFGDSIEEFFNAMTGKAPAFVNLTPGITIFVALMGLAIVIQVVWDQVHKSRKPQFSKEELDGIERRALTVIDLPGQPADGPVAQMRRDVVRLVDEVRRLSVR